ncbi:MAG: MgtC/SapB family protein [Bdellovibrionota bacterium]
MINPSQWDLLQTIHFFGPKVLAAILCGGVIGLERELKHKPAGIKTNILICLGSAIYTAVSVMIAMQFADTNHYGDPARISAQIVSGIGFLGGGTIIQSRGTILGLTTAATIWVIAAIGIAIGLGHADFAILMTFTVLFVLLATNLFEDKVLGRSLSFAAEIVVDDPHGKVRLGINQALAQNDLLLDDFDISTKNNFTLLKCRYRGHRNDHKKFILDLWNLPGIKEVKQH